MRATATARRRWLGPVLVLLAMIVVAAGTWVLAGRFQSPAQVAADASPPVAGPITAAVRDGGLSASFTARVRFGAAQATDVPLTLDPSAVITRTPV